MSGQKGNSGGSLRKVTDPQRWESMERLPRALKELIWYGEANASPTQVLEEYEWRGLEEAHKMLRKVNAAIHRHNIAEACLSFAYAKHDAASIADKYIKSVPLK